MRTYRHPDASNQCKRKKQTRGDAVQETILKAYEKLPTLKNGALIIRNSFPQLVDIDNLQAVHFGNIDQWLEVRE